MLRIHEMCDDILVCISGKPTAQGMPHETIPTNLLSFVNGPPESP